MSSRPTDWSPLGLSGDPTPGDYDSVMAVSSYMQAINTSAGVVKQGLDAIYGTATSTEDFAGQTATAMTGLITKELHNFLENVATSFAEASAAVTTFAAALQEQQSVADTALSQAQGLNKTTDAAQISSLANTASGAGDTLSSASSTASTAVQNATSLVTWPDTFWDRFWEALGWLAIILMIPAIIFGGAFALVAFGLNFVLFIKSAVDFFSGKESVGAFLLSFLGILAPTTEPLDVIGILKGLITGIKDIGTASVTFLSDGIKTFGNLVELFGGARAFLTAIPELALDAVKIGGIYVVDTIKSIPAFVVSGGKLLLDGITGLPKTISTELGGTKWLRIFLPVTAKEIDVVGLGGALRLGVLERGFGFAADPALNFKMALQGLKTGAPSLIKLSSLSSDLHLADLKGGDLLHLDPNANLLSTLRPEFNPHLTINPADLSAPSRMAINRLDDSVLLQNPTELTHLFNHEAIVINTGDMTIVKFTEGIRPATVPGLEAPAHVATTSVDSLGGVNAMNGVNGVSGSINSLVSDLKLTGFTADLKAPLSTSIDTTINTSITTTIDVSVNSSIGTALGTVTSLLHDPQKALDLLDHSSGGSLATHAISSALPKDLAGVEGSADLAGKGKAPAFDPGRAGTAGSLDGHATPQPLHPDQINGPATVQDAWLSYQAAHINLANAVERVDESAGKVGESSTGMTAAENQAHADVTDAKAKLDDANVAMLSFGADPLRFAKLQQDADQAYLKEHPGLLGGTRNSTTREVSLRTSENQPLGTASLHYDTGTGELVRPNGITEPLHFAVVEDGMIRAADPVSPLEWRQFTPNGVLHSSNHLLEDGAGNVVGEIRVNGANTRAVTDIGGVQQPWEYAAHTDGGFTLTAPGTGVHELYDAANVHIETRTELLSPHGRPLGPTVVTDLRGPVPVHALTGGGTETLTSLGAGWRLEDSATGHFSVFNADGVMTHEGFPVRAPGGRGLGSYTYDYGSHTHTITRPDGKIETYHPSPRTDGTLRFVDDADPNHWIQMDGHGNVAAESHEIDATHVIELDHSTGTATVLDQGTVSHAGAFTVDHQGEITVTDATSGVREVFGQDFQHLETQTDLFAHDGTAFNATAVTDYRGGAAQYRVTGAGGQGHALTHTPTGGWELRDPINGRGYGFGAHGRQIAEIHTLHDVQAGAGGARAGLGELSFDPATGLGQVGHNGVNRNVVVVANATGLHVTDAANPAVWRQFDGQGNLLSEGRETFGPGGGVDGTLTIYHVADNTHPANSAATVENGLTTAWDHYTLNGDGTYQLDTATGALRHYDPNNALLQEHVPLRGTGTRTNLVVHADYRNGAATYAVHDAGGPIPHVAVTAHNGGFRVTDTRANGGGGYKDFGRSGAITHERIPVLDRKGRWNQTSYQVDYAAVPGGPTRARWTLLDDSTGNAFTSTRGMPGGQTRPAYNAAGDVQVKPNGDVHLVGGDGTPVYIRETPAGRNFELFRDGAGKRYWHEFLANGNGFHTEPVYSGTREFGTEADSSVYRDVGSGGRTVRTFRKALDGGLVRADRMPDGTWTWTRFDSRGNEMLSGTRTFSLTGDGWTDTAVVNGVTHVAQRQYSRLGISGTSAHYREYAIDGAAGNRTVSANYKEISPQAKDTGSASGPLTWTRLSEQRPPHWLWKTTDNLSWYDKTFGYFFGRKYGALDFPHNGWISGDSRLQVFRWEESANGVSTHGVRVVLPDGSSADFSEAGEFLRGTTKLETGHTLEVKTDVTPNGHAGPGVRALVWKRLDSNKAVLDSGFRYFTNQRDWVEVSDRFANPAAPHPAYQPGGHAVTRMSEHGNGDVTEFTDPARRPTFDPAANAVTPHPGGAVPSITRNSLGQIVGRTDEWHGATVTATGDARTGEWQWTHSTGATGTRISSRNTRWTGSWDDSYTDFQRINGQWQMVRDFRSLDKGTSLTSEFDAAAGRWRSVYRDAQGNEVIDAAHPQGLRQFDHGGGNWRDVPPPGKLNAAWRDVHPTQLDAHGNPLVLQQTFDGRVRIYSTTDHTGNAWKEYDHGAVFRERKPAPDGSGLWRETQSWQKQWRETDAAGNLVRYRALSGRIWERTPLGQWKMVGREYEYKGLANDFRGYNRSLRDHNRREFTVQDGAVGRFHTEGHNFAVKTLLDFAQDYTFDVVANIIITGAENNWDFAPADWGKIFLGGFLSSGVKNLGAVLQEKVLKGPKDGLANVDGGKDWNRNPYNHDKTWDNEWAGNETPPRWRSTTYDYVTNTLLLSTVGSFVSNAVTGAVFGVGSDHVKVSGAEALQVGGLSAAGTLIGGAVVSGPKTLAHQLSSGRLFHKAGVADLTLVFGEKLFEKWLITYELVPKLGLKPHVSDSTTTG